MDAASGTTTNTPQQTLVAPVLSPSQRKQARQVARIICHIRDEIHEQSPSPHSATHCMPTRWMIDCLVYNVFSFTGEHTGDWQALVTDTLSQIKCITRSDSTARTLVQLDNRTALFPNNELFDETDAHRFSQALLDHLAAQLA